MFRTEYNFKKYDEKDYQIILKPIIMGQDDSTRHKQSLLSSNPQ